MPITPLQSVSTLARLRTIAAGLAFLFIGIFIAIHGTFTNVGAAFIMVVFVLGGVALIRWMAGPVRQPWRELTEMGTLGTAAMLLGWWADVGFVPIIRDGICHCSCVDINAGWGLPDVRTWMYGGMMAASATMLPTRWSASEFARFAAMLLGMFAGMFVSEWCLARIAPGPARLHFLITIFSNAVAMTAGMWIVCIAWTRLAAPRPRNDS